MNQPSEKAIEAGAKALASKRQMGPWDILFRGAKETLLQDSKTSLQAALDSGEMVNRE